MVEHARDFAAAGIPFIFDPGQGLPMFSGEELRAMCEGATALTVNDYEARIVEQKTGQPVEALATAQRAIVVTRGAEGAHVFADGKRIEIPPVKPEGVVDPTGCGDAFRAGLLYGRSRGWDWKRSAELASVMGSIKIAHRGGQNHRPARDHIAERLKAAFGGTL